MNKESDKTALLEAHFRAARAAAPEPGHDLAARVLADAAAVQARQEAVTARASPDRRLRRRFGEMLRAVGGWPAAAGLTTAVLAGLWIGFAPPQGLAVATRVVLGDDAYVIDIEPGAGFGFDGGAS